MTEVVPVEKLWERAHELAATIARKPSVAVQGTVRALWESFDMTRTAALDTALKYCMMGNPLGVAEVNRDETMGKKKIYTVR